MYLFGTKENLRSKNRPCIIHPKENFGEPFIPQFSLPVILFVKYFGGLFCVVDLQKEHSSDCSGESSKGVDRESGSSASSSSVSLSSSSHNSHSNGSVGGSDARVLFDKGGIGGRNGPVPTRSTPLTPLQSRLQAIEDLKCAADYLLGVGAGVCGRSNNEKCEGSGDANCVGEGGGGGGGGMGGDVHAMHG
jgi:hypothetical protein